MRVHTICCSTIGAMTEGIQGNGTGSGRMVKAVECGMGMGAERGGHGAAGRGPGAGWSGVAELRALGIGRFLEPDHPAPQPAPPVLQLVPNLGLVLQYVL